MTILATVYVDISNEYRDLQNGIWIIVSYLLATTAVQPLFGKFSDILGRFEAVAAATLVFCVGSVICAAAKSMGMLVAGRAIQGIGGGGLISMVSVILSDVTSERDRGKYTGALAASWGAASAVGPVMGGAIVENASWRIIFWINLPVCVPTIIVMFFALKIPRPQGTIREKIRRMDILGSLVFQGFIIPIIIAFSWAGQGHKWISGQVLGTIFGSLAVGVIFLIVEWKVAVEPIIPLRLFKIRNVTASAIVTDSDIRECDKENEEAFQSLLRGKKLYLALAGLDALLFIAALDLTIIATVYVEIANSFNALSRAEWTVTSYMLASTAIQPLFGKFSDILGRTKAIIVAVLLFVLGSILCAVSRTMDALIISRAVQGLGGGGIMSLIFVVIADILSERERGKYIGVFTCTWGFASAVAPILGGVIVQHADWRLIFWINIPFCAIALVLVLFAMRLPRPGGLVKEKAKKIDVLGACVFLAGTVPLLLGLSWGGREHSWTSPLVLSCVIAGTLVLVGVLFLSGLGAGACIQPIMMAAQAAVTGHDMAAVTTLCAFLRSLGAILCVAILSSIMHSVIKTGLTQLAAEHPLYIFVIARVADNQSAIYADDVSEELRGIIVGIYMKAMRLAFYALLPFSILLFVSTLGFKHVELNRQRKKTIDYSKQWMSTKSDNEEAMREWNRTITEAIEQAKHEMEEQKAKQKQQTEPKKESDEKQQLPKRKQEPPPQSKEKTTEKTKDYIATVGRVMIELPHDIEGFFQDGLGANIYAENVLFREPRHSGFHIAGKKQYLGVARVLRIAMNAYFTNPRITITHMRQVPISPTANKTTNNDLNSTDVVDSTKNVEVYVRWVFEGMPRHTGLIGGHESRYEGEFRYAMDSGSGLVALHEVTAIHPTPPVGFIPSGLARWMGWLSPRGSLSLSRRY
ncbi:hypothetical protein H4S08_002468 [Coemansia sp. RSA 1365]|nr:hypothetical protein H4S08_002468 [Coemansia sp. RSA 1365]